MISSIQNNASAMQAFSNHIQASANNVANALSDEFKSSTVHNVEAKPRGVTTVIAKDPTPGPLVEDPVKNDGSRKELSNTDIAREMVQQMTAQHGFDANAKTIQTQDDTIGAIIDLIG
ncbi:MAG: flagellar basal body rod C-terminal domain-containing protein [Desulfotignum sp.]|nr:flagellar basal body rod C-terminal domain-containing protein [Desulfotignum sp.]